MCRERERERERERDWWGEMAEAPVSGETQISLATSSMFPGFRFSPTDEELISYYLKKKLEGSDQCVDVIAEVEICNHEPWDLPAKSVIQSENEWFFFSPRGRKYPNGLQSKRATQSGYWKATGKERNVKSGSNQIGTKRTLVFHMGRAPRGERTEWIMHEYCMSGQSQDSLVVCRLRKNIDFRLNDSPGQGSSSQRHLSTENNSNVGLSEVCVEQSGLLEGAKAGECCSKEGSSSYNSHSVEQQVDCGSDSDQKLMNEFSQLGSCSHQGGDDEDCFADILKDDIIDLGKSLLPLAQSRTPDLWAVIAGKSEDDERSQQPEQEIPSSGDDLRPQGLAYRRIRMKQKKPKHYGASEPLKVETSNKNYSVKKLNGPQPEQQAPKCLLGLHSDQRVKRRRSMSVAVFVILALLVLLVSFLGVPWQVKRFMYASLL